MRTGHGPGPRTISRVVLQLLMNGFTAVPVSVDSEAANHTKWLGISIVSGPRWLKMPILTTGMLGLQIIWSVEMSYGELA
jgi:hypothetical protein